MNKRPTENKAFWLIEKKDRMALAGSRSSGDSILENFGLLYKNNNILPCATYRLDVRKPERMQDKEFTTPLYNMGVTK